MAIENNSLDSADDPAAGTIETRFLEMEARIDAIECMVGELKDEIR